MSQLPSEPEFHHPSIYCKPGLLCPLSPHHPRKAFSEYIGIPLRNLEEWEAGRRKMPEYLLRMLIYYVKMNQYLEKNGMKEEMERKVFDEQE